MRKLTASQKKLLDTLGKGAITIDDVPGLEAKLAKINDYETMWSDADRYLNDARVKELYGK